MFLSEDLGVNIAWLGYGRPWYGYAEPLLRFAFVSLDLWLPQNYVGNEQYYQQDNSIEGAA